MNDEILDALLQLGLTPLNWVDASLFSKFTGIKQTKLTHRRAHWPENEVWTKQDGNILYSIKGYNQWLTEQAQSRCQKACGSETAQSKSISKGTKSNTASLFRIPQLRKVSRQQLKLEAS